MKHRIYELGNAIGQKKGIEYLTEDCRETQEDFKKIGSKLYDGAKWTGKILTKASYPITGNLSLPVRKRIEKKLGKNIFNQDDAASITCLTNLISYPLITYAIANSILPGTPTILAPFIYGLVEAKFRFEEEETFFKEMIITRFREDNTKASLQGKLFSLPIEFGMGIYDGIKSKGKTK